MWRLIRWIRSKVQQVLLCAVHSQTDVGIPKHIAIIYDGPDRSYLHLNPSSYLPELDSLIPTVYMYGIQYLTLLLISSAAVQGNKKHASEALGAVCDVIKYFAERIAREKLSVKLRILGDIESLGDAALTQQLKDVIANINTAGDTTPRPDDQPARLNVYLGINYSSMTQTLRAAESLHTRNSFMPSDLVCAMYNSEVPPPSPDILLRTSEECRVGNNLLWEITVHPCLLVFRNVRFSFLGPFKMFRLITRWQVFVLERRRMHSTASSPSHARNYRTYSRILTRYKVAIHTAIVQRTRALLSRHQSHANKDRKSASDTPSTALLNSSASYHQMPGLEPKVKLSRSIEVLRKQRKDDLAVEEAAVLEDILPIDSISSCYHPLRSSSDDSSDGSASRCNFVVR